MRSFFNAVVVTLICGCAHGAKTQPIQIQPYFDLRQPVYVYADESFWLGCEGDAAGDEACRNFRIKEIYKGFDQWFRYFLKFNRPKAIFVLTDKDMPEHPVNPVIHLGISEDFCGDADIVETIVPKPAGACYSWDKDEFISHNTVRIVFKNITQLYDRTVAHEIGHAFGRGHRDLPRGTGSVMSYHKKTDVTPLDLKTMCKMHHECRTMKRKRHKWKGLF